MGTKYLLPIFLSFRRAFTLIELLVVMGIVAMLVGLLGPALARAKGTAHGAVCRGNLRQIGLGLLSYTQDTARFPLFGRVSSLLEPDGAKWYDDIRSYLPARWSDKTFNCPTYRWQIRDGRGDKRSVWVSFGSYGYNAGSADERDQYRYGIAARFEPFARLGRVSVREDEVRAPADMIALGDSLSRRDSNTKPNFTEGLELLSRRLHVFDFPPVERTLEAAWLRHNGFSNLTFCDGHVEAVKLADLLMSTEARHLRRWHSDHQPHEELFR